MPDSVNEAAPSEPCERCGHPWNDHLLHAELPYPTDGWMTCPVAGCECYGTWSVDEESRAAMEQYRAEHLRVQAASDPERRGP